MCSWACVHVCGGIQRSTHGDVITLRWLCPPFLDMDGITVSRLVNNRLEKFRRQPSFLSFIILSLNLMYTLFDPPALQKFASDVLFPKVTFSANTSWPSPLRSTAAQGGLPPPRVLTFLLIRTPQTSGSEEITSLYLFYLEVLWLKEVWFFVFWVFFFLLFSSPWDSTLKETWWQILFLHLASFLLIIFLPVFWGPLLLIN